MALKIISYIFIMLLAICFAAPTQVKDVPFDVNEVINRVSLKRSPTPNPQPITPSLPTGEFLIDTSVIYLTNQFYQENSSVAFDGNNYLVVWQDDRNGLDIYGARVSQTGVILDPAGIPISTAINDQESPSVAFDGINYLVVWADYRNYNTSQCDIYGARVSQNGVILDPDGIPISTDMDCQNSPSIAYDGNNYLIVWNDGRNDYSDIYGARINRAGTVLDTNDIAIAVASNYQVFPSVAFDGNNYLVVWQDERSGLSVDVYGARVSQTGVVLDTSFPVSIAINTQIGFPWVSVTFGSSNYLVVWEDYRSGYSYDICGARVSQAGIVLDTNYISISSATDNQMYPSIAFDGNNYLVAWNDWRSGCSVIYGTRVNQAGIILNPEGFVISTTTYGQFDVSIAFGNTNYLVVWTDHRSGPFICGARVSQAGIVLDTSFPISTTAYKQNNSSVAFDGSNYLVVWADGRNGYSDIYGARVSQSGQVLDPNCIPISIEPNWQGTPSVAFDGNNYFVVWQDDRNGLDIYGARVNQTGVVLDPNGIAISTADNYQTFPSIAFGGTNYLVVWEDQRNLDFDIYGARVNQTGTVLDLQGIPISTDINDQRFPSVALNGTNYLIVWEGWRSYYSSDVYGAKVNPQGIVIDSFPVSLQQGNQISPALAKGSGNQVLITYSGWIDSIIHRPANTMRIWGKFSSDIGIEEENSKVKIQTAKLLEIYPNPFSKQTAISFMPNASHIELKIYDISGKLVKSFATKNQQLTSNNYFVWDGTDDSGQKLSAGVYFCCLKTTESTSETKEIIIMR